MTKVNPGQSGEGPPPSYPPPPTQAFPPPQDAAYPPPYGAPPPPGYNPPPPGQGYSQGYPQGYNQQQGYSQQPGYATHGATTVVVQQPGMGPQLGSAARYYSVPVLIVCQSCRATVTTSTSFSVGTYAWLIAGILLFVGCWLGCCLIPFCVDGCKDVIHTCPNCHTVVGRYSRL